MAEVKLGEWVPLSIRGNPVAEQVYRESVAFVASLFEQLEEARRRVVVAETAVAEVRALLVQWRLNRSAPDFGRGSPGPLFAAGMAFASDALIADLAAALERERPAKGHP